jgi:catechol 2,3-dioxygenase-like lactoylglutathione lyase family enzyme
MELGAFSISLTVEDLEASEAFYRRLGFARMGGDPEHHYVILKNGEHIIGLFQGMFDRNILTFNPGWNQSAEPLESFQDVRELRQLCLDQGLTVTQETNIDSESGPASFVVVDPDGNPVLIDQHR